MIEEGYVIQQLGPVDQFIHFWLDKRHSMSGISPIGLFTTSNHSAFDILLNSYIPYIQSIDTNVSVGLTIVILYAAD